MSTITTTIEKKWNGNIIKIQGKRVVNKSIFEIGLVVEGQAKTLCPIKTGRLAGSITTQASDGQGTAPRAPAGPGDMIQKPNVPNEVYVGTAVEYGPYQEFGTVRNNAQPFLRPALDLAKGKALTIVKENGRYEFREYMK